MAMVWGTAVPFMKKTIDMKPSCPPIRSFISPKTTPIRSLRHFNKCMPHYPPFRDARRMNVKVSAGNGEAPKPETLDNSVRERELRILLALIVQYPAVRGSLAVGFGYLITPHLNPLGTLHWDSHDALTGILFALPIMFFDALIMIPNYQPKTIQRTMKFMVPASVAEKFNKYNTENQSTTDVTSPKSVTPLPENNNNNTTEQNSNLAQATTTLVATPPTTSLSSTETTTPANLDEQMVQVERNTSVRDKQHPILTALYRAQNFRVLNNPGNLLNPLYESILLFLIHISDEMLYRGMLLAFLVQWMTDRFYEAGADDYITVFGGNFSLATPQVAALASSVGLTVAAVALIVQQELFPLQIFDKAKDKYMKKRKAGGKKTEDIADAAGTNVINILEEVQRNVRQQQLWSASLNASLEFVQWSTLCTSFLLTGNILAPITGSITADVLYSVWQRTKYKKLKAEAADSAAKFQEKKDERTALIEVVNEYRKEKIEKKDADDLSNKKDMEESGKIDDHVHEEDGKNGNDDAH